MSKIYVTYLEQSARRRCLYSLRLLLSFHFLRNILLFQQSWGPCPPRPLTKYALEAMTGSGHGNRKEKVSSTRVVKKLLE